MGLSTRPMTHHPSAHRMLCGKAAHAGDLHVRSLMQSLFALSLGLLMAGASHLVIAQTELSGRCDFERALKFDQERNMTFPAARIKQTMLVERGITSEATLRLDGSVRATNSRKWTALNMLGFETFETRFAGDFGEILTIEHQLRNSSLALRGSFRSSLVSPGVSSTTVMLGSCLLN